MWNVKLPRYVERRINLPFAEWSPATLWDIVSSANYSIYEFLYVEEQ